MTVSRSTATELWDQATAVKEALGTVCDPDHQSQLEEAHRTLMAIAKSAERKQGLSIRTIDPNASNSELKEARRISAVQRGEEIYLPTVNPAEICMPNIFLRCALFAATKTAPDQSESRYDVPILGRADVELAGQRLCGTDGRVFAQLLGLHQNLPLLKNGDSAARCETTLSALGQATFQARSDSIRKSVQNSLRRLSSVKLQIKTSSGLRITITSLITCNVDDVEINQATIKFSFSEELAHLFGMNEWTSINKRALSLTGLTGWLALFYRTHSKPYPLKISTLQELSGITSRGYEFRRLLIKSLEKLTNEKQGDKTKVKGFVIDDDLITVWMTHWK